MAEVTDKVQDVAEEGKEKISSNGNHNELKKLLLPAAAGVGTMVAGYAATKAPELIRERVMPKLEERGSDEAAKVGKEAVEKMKDQGGATGAVGKVAGVAGKVMGGGGNGGGGGGKKTRRLPIQRYTDVALPVDKVYELWTDFDKYPQFMHRVLSVEKRKNDEVQWNEKIWFSKREWKGKITERRKNDRIVWKTTSGANHRGIVSFHKLDDNLTRVMVEMEFVPTGIFEKMGSGLRFVKRAVQADLARFKAYAEMKDAKGLEYGNDKGNDRGQESRSRSNGDSDSDSNGDSKSDEEREQEREQRAERRKQRQA